ncbi:MAG TPA: hypothetical protein DEP42_06120 [Ruminococcaceae bacterium]|nr:hypothetical protein [Oscillospiraceae bacterium]
MTQKHKQIYHLVGSSIIIIVFIIIIGLNFKSFFPALKQQSFSSKIQGDTPINIPRNLNFLSDDKQTFLTYCKSFYGDKLPMKVDSSTFIYEGAVDGYRLYRIQATLIETGSARQLVKLGNYTFESDRLYRPSPLGLYLIRNNEVYTLENAYQSNLLSMDDLYTLYIKKDPIANTRKISE